MEKFYLDDYIKNGSIQNNNQMDEMGGIKKFEKLCERIYLEFTNEWTNENEGFTVVLDIQKRAIIGYEKEVSYFKDKIKEYIKNNKDTDITYPNYYKSLEDGVYNYNWGLAGLSEWFGDEYQESSSAKIIGDRIYFLENGKMVLKEQKIEQRRREQLVRALLLPTPEERTDKDFHELYMLNGTRITIFRDRLTKKNQDVIIFRRYIIPEYSFEEQAARKTIPQDAIELFKSMVKIGYNIAVTGAVRTSKTTFLSTWQSYENRELEGVMIETDPEIPMHIIMKDAPIIQIIADEERLKEISKNLLRSDADYFVMAEARDGNALDLAVRIANKGSRRMKITFHSSDPLDFCYDVANEIARTFEVNLSALIRKVSKSFHYIFHFVQLTNKSEKRLKCIYELSSGVCLNDIKITEICRYDYSNDEWRWRYSIGEDKRLIGEEENQSALIEFDRELMLLASAHPIDGDGIYTPLYGNNINGRPE